MLTDLAEWQRKEERQGRPNVGWPLPPGTAQAIWCKLIPYGIGNIEELTARIESLPDTPTREAIESNRELARTHGCLEMFNEIWPPEAKD
jgi:hypothetical protein